MAAKFQVGSLDYLQTSVVEEMRAALLEDPGRLGYSQMDVDFSDKNVEIFEEWFKTPHNVRFRTRELDLPKDAIDSAFLFVIYRIIHGEDAWRNFIAAMTACKPEINKNTLPLIKNAVNNEYVSRYNGFISGRSYLSGLVEISGLTDVNSNYRSGKAVLHFADPNRARILAEFLESQGW